MCLTDDESLAEKMRVLRDHGMSKHKRYWHDYIGFNYRMTNIQAAIGLAQLERIENFIASKIDIANNYKHLLNGLNGVHFQKEYPDAESVHWMVSLMFDEEFGHERDDIIKYLESFGIETRPVFYPIHHMPPHKQDLKLGVCEKISRHSISLPSFTKLDKDKISYIADKIISLADKNKAGVSRD